jgi:hypothetical protein
MENYTSQHLSGMTPEEFVVCREAGHEDRRNLTHDVMRSLALPDAWDVNGEYRNEFGGLFPVQLRFYPLNHHFYIALCSPGEFSEDWMMVLMTPDGLSMTTINTHSAFNPVLINSVLSLAANLEREGYTYAHIRNALLALG